MLFLIAIKRDHTDKETSFTGVTMWAKKDKEALNYVISSGNAPDWNNVYRRKTISLVNNEVIEDIKITGDMTKEFLTRKLPKNIKGTKTI